VEGGSATVGAAAFAIVTADFNGDGILDLMTANTDNNGGNDLSVLLGNGDGTFQSQVEYACCGFPPNAMTIGDFNGDGILDAATTYVPYPPDNIPKFSIVLGNGDGSFQSPLIYPVAYAGWVAAGDWNGDGKLDAVVTDGPFDTIEVLVDAPQTTASVTPASLIFPTQVDGTTSKAMTSTLTNTGQAALSISSISGGTDFHQTNNCGPGLRAGASCTISATFSPQLIGLETDQITIVDNTPDSPQIIGVRGNGTIVAVAPALVNFGSVPVGKTSPAKTVTVTNAGQRTVNISNIELQGSNAGDFAQTSNCGATLLPGASCTVSVTFTPTAKGLRDANLSVFDDGGGSPQQVKLGGTGT
jgi:hypothetical protein